MTIKVLMFGWEFPPNISGGLGMACFGLCKGLAQLGGVSVDFVIPQLESAKATDVTAVESPQDFVNLISLPILECSQAVEIDLTEVVRMLPDGVFDTRLGAPLPPDITLEQLKPYSQDLVGAALAYAKSVRAFLRQHSAEFDVIHVHDWLTCLAGIEAKKISGKPLLMHIHSTEVDRAGAAMHPVIWAIERYGMDCADHLLAVSNFTRGVILQHYAQAPSKVTTVYNATAPFAPQLLIKHAHKYPLICFLGRVTQQKGPMYFVQAAALALAKNPDLRFVMAGEGDLLPAMKALARTLGIESQLHFPGFLQMDEVTHLLTHSDVYVMPSVSEPFGISALEAIAAGIPAILSRQSGVVELFENVVKVDYWDVAAIAEAMLKLASNGPYAEQLQQAAQQELAHITWLASAKQLLPAYRALV